MGDCDRLKHYISDYLENGLDPATRKEFEDALERSPELNSMTNRARVLSSKLKNLNYHSCSEDFQFKLREKIHTKPEPLISRQKMVRYSFAFSVVIILFFVTYSMMNVSDSPEINPVVAPENSDFQIKTSNPASNPFSGNNVKSLVNEKQVDIKTKSAQDMVGDSSRIIDKPGIKKESPPIKYVDQKE